MQRAREESGLRESLSLWSQGDAHTLRRFPKQGPVKEVSWTILTLLHPLEPLFGSHRQCCEQSWLFSLHHLGPTQPYHQVKHCQSGPPQVRLIHSGQLCFRDPPSFEIRSGKYLVSKQQLYPLEKKKKARQVCLFLRHSRICYNVCKTYRPLLI